MAPSHVDGLLNLSDFEERVGFGLPPGPYETVAGFLMASLVRLPEVAWRETYPNLARLADKLALRPSFKDTVPPRT